MTSPKTSHPWRTEQEVRRLVEVNLRLGGERERGDTSRSHGGRWSSHKEESVIGNVADSCAGARAGSGRPEIVSPRVVKVMEKQNVS